MVRKRALQIAIDTVSVRYSSARPRSAAMTISGRGLTRGPKMSVMRMAHAVIARYRLDRGDGPFHYSLPICVTREALLAGSGLPTIPLVPVSSTQAVVGAMLGLAILKGNGGINFSILVRIASGWVTTPLIALVICFVSLSVLRNFF